MHNADGVWVETVVYVYKEKLNLLTNLCRLCILYTYSSNVVNSEYRRKTKQTSGRTEERRTTMKKRKLNGKEFERHGWGFLALGIVWAVLGMMPMGMVFAVIGLEEIVRGRNKTKDDK